MPKGWNQPIVVVGLLAIAATTPIHARQDVSAGVFRASVDYVSITAVVRDHRGRPVSSLSRDDFQVLDDGQPRQILDLRAESSAPASVALLIDGSGSMRIGGADAISIRISDAILDSLDARRDDAALFTFDTRLLTLQDFTHDLDAVRGKLDHVDAFGSTSLFDAIGGTAGLVAQRTQNRRAVVVLTDGSDNASTSTAQEIATIASSIDVPVYVFALLTPAETTAVRRRNPLSELAQLTGGSFYAAHDETSLQSGIHSLVEELRHQYVVAFESASEPGWRAVQLKTRDHSHRIRARSWYRAGAGVSE
jgi:Ca-activated chloride channel family protein